MSEVCPTAVTLRGFVRYGFASQEYVDRWARFLSFSIQSVICSARCSPNPWFPWVLRKDEGDKAFSVDLIRRAYAYWSAVRNFRKLQVVSRVKGAPKNITQPSDRGCRCSPLQAWNSGLLAAIMLQLISSQPIIHCLFVHASPSISDEGSDPARIERPSLRIRLCSNLGFRADIIWMITGRAYIQSQRTVASTPLSFKVVIDWRPEKVL